MADPQLTAMNKAQDHALRGLVAFAQQHHAAYVDDDALDLLLTFTTCDPATPL
jgi:hypothetical protein